MKVLVTGGAGFIGSATVLHFVEDLDFEVVNVDKLTYAANAASLASLANDPRYVFVRADIADRPVMEAIFDEHEPDAVLNLAAESHVDRSIASSNDFIRTNIMGTFILLEAARRYWERLPRGRKEAFRFQHVSTDEVYGSLGSDDPAFTELSRYVPSSPYSASKASSNHLVTAWHVTHRFPGLITNCSNNYGPRQFPEKLIPSMILKAMQGKPLPVYGNGENVRDWLHVEDHARALGVVLTRGRVGHTYNIGGETERQNLEVVRMLCDLIDELVPEAPVRPATDLITFVVDRPGHDFRYAIDTSKIRGELGFAPRHKFETGLRETVMWYLANEGWWQPLQCQFYQGHRPCPGGDWP